MSPTTSIASRLGTALAALALLSVGEYSADPVSGDSFTVTREDDPSPDGCLPGDCSLREALLAAEATLGPDAVAVPTGTFVLTDLLPGIGTDVMIKGAGPAHSLIQAAPGRQLFHVLTTGSLRVERVSLKSDNGVVGSAGTVMFVDATISDSSTYSSALLRNWGDKPLTLTRVVLTGNQGRLITSDSSIDASLTIVDSIVAGNRGADILINSAGPTSIQRTLFENNLVGTAVIHSFTKLSLEDSTLRLNGLPGGLSMAVFTSGETSIAGTSIVENEGVGIFDHGDLRLNSSTVASNKLGGVLLDARPDRPPDQIRNSTISGNSTPATGGGLRVETGARVHLSNVTIAQNLANGGGGGVYVSPTSQLTLSNTAISDNSAGTGTGQDCVGTLISGGHNLIEDVRGCNITGSEEGIISGVSAMLAPLADNGGPTETHALLANSPAIDAGSPLRPGTSAEACELYDQRGERRRPRQCDIGAYELKGRLNRLR